MATAYHEAGHAVIAMQLGRGFSRVSIQPDADSLGRTLYSAFNRSFNPDINSSTKTRLRIEQCIMCALAGPEAEAQFKGSSRGLGAHGDYKHAVDMASYECGSNEEITAYRKWLRAKTANKVKISWGQIEAVAEALVERTSLTRKEAEQVVRSALASSSSNSTAALSGPVNARTSS